MIKTKLVNGAGKGHGAKVTDENTVMVQDTHVPPKGEKTSFTIFRQYMLDSNGSNDMTVNGSVTNVEFTIDADPDFDIYIKKLSFVIADAGATLSSFGTIGSLTNGCSLSYRTDAGPVTIADSLTTNFSVIRLCSGNPAFGDGISAFRASNVTGLSEAYIPVLDLGDTFGPQFGIRLRAGTNDKLIFTIKDNVSGLDQFDIIAYGIKRL